MNPREVLPEARRTARLMGILADALETSLDENARRDELGSAHYAALRAEKERGDRAWAEVASLWDNLHEREAEVLRLSTALEAIPDAYWDASGTSRYWDVTVWLKTHCAAVLSKAVAVVSGREELANLIASVESDWEYSIRSGEPVGPCGVVTADAILASDWLARHDAELARVLLVKVKSVLRGEGIPGHPGESIALNEADALLHELAGEVRS